MASQPARLPSQANAHPHPLLLADSPCLPETLLCVQTFQTKGCNFGLWSHLSMWVLLIIPRSAQGLLKREETPLTSAPQVALSEAHWKARAWEVGGYSDPLLGRANWLIKDLALFVKP